MGMRKLIFLFIILGSFLAINCNALELCEMSHEYSKWLELGDDRFNYEAPPYCEDSIKKTSKLGLSKYSIYSSNRPRYSSLELGYLSNVRDQFYTGSCWTFEANSCVETSARKEGLGDFDLSEKHMEYNTARYPYVTRTLINPNGLNRELDGGGNFIQAASYYFRFSGPIDESKMPFTEYNDYIADDSIPTDAPVLLVGNYDVEYYSQGVCSDKSIESIKEKVVKYGSVGASLFMGSNSSSNSYYTYANGNYFYYPGSQETNHAVNIVGWDDSISSSNFKNTPSRNGAWIVRNSWGESFGDNGYFYVSYDDHNICRRIRNFNDISRNDYDNAYSANYGLANFRFDSSTGRTFYASAKFTKATAATEYLDRVSFEVEANTDYEVYLSKSNKLDTNTDWILLGSGASTSRGVRTINFNTEEINGDYTIIVKYVSSSEYFMPALCRVDDANEMYRYANITLGKNYYSHNGTTWYDLGKYTSSPSSIDGCSSVIFAYTRNEVQGSQEDSYDISINEITGSSNLVYVNSSDYYTVNFELTNISEPSNITQKIVDSNNVDVTSNFVLSDTILSGVVTIKLSDKVTSGTYKYVINYKEIERSIEFKVYNVIESNKYLINDTTMTVSLGNSKEFTLNELNKNINSNGAAYKLLDSKGNEITNNSSNIGTGYSLVINGKVFKIVIIGDISGDGKIMSNDALLISRYLVGLTQLNEYQQKASDTSKDSKIMSNDALLISRFLVGLRTEL